MKQANLICEAFLRIWQEKKPNNVTSEYSDVSVDNITDSSFGMICVQFKALGYIQLSEKKHSDQTYWSLTKYGEFVMTQLVAQRR